jgi:hypothetical protein
MEVHAKQAELIECLRFAVDDRAAFLDDDLGDEGL